MVIVFLIQVKKLARVNIFISYPENLAYLSDLTKTVKNLFNLQIKQLG